MHPNHNARDLELIDYDGAGSYAWLRAELSAAVDAATEIERLFPRSVEPEPAPDDDVRYVLTQAGRDDLHRAQAFEALFGRAAIAS